jgi:hypothetical protein
MPKSGIFWCAPGHVFAAERSAAEPQPKPKPLTTKGTKGHQGKSKPVWAANPLHAGTGQRDKKRIQETSDEGKAMKICAGRNSAANLVEYNGAFEWLLIRKRIKPPTIAGFLEFFLKIFRTYCPLYRMIRNTRWGNCSGRSCSTETPNREITA